ncbi:MAG: TrmB family transcriptional regulator [Suilimivivens sp.]
MEENTVLDKLGLFGLTRQEAAIYLCLYRNGELTGYEVAKYTGISRSNVYSGLSGLTDKGAAYLEEGNASKYIAVPIENFCENKIRSLNREKEYLIENIPVMKEKEIGYITITGSRNIWNKIIDMIKEAEKRIYFSASLSVIEELKDEFLTVIDRKIKLVFITDGMPKEKEFVNDAICYIGSTRENNIRLIIDSEYALTGELTGKKDDTCLYTGQENFIKVFKEALRNEIKLIELTEGERQK